MQLLTKSSIFLFIVLTILTARPPTSLPGEELSNDTYLNYMINNSLTTKELEEIKYGKEQNAVQDTNALFETWSAPSIADQIAKDTGSIKLGMGAVFVPRMSEEGAIEPDIMVKDKDGKILRAGQTGSKFNLLPGAYTIHIGNLAKFPITREVFIEEGKITPVIPDWCALRIEVIDENAKPIRGEYDLASLQPLTPIGRGRGRDINLAENIKIWFLPIGTYKIIGVGASLNSISNFLTVRLTTAGEFIRYSVVQSTSDQKILGGGILIEDIKGRKDKNWNHNINIGGSVDLSFITNKKSDTSDNSLGLSLLLYDRFNFKKNKLELNNLAKIDMTLNMTKFRTSSVKTNIDELRITSLFTYRLFPRFGPYARGEYISAMLPKNAKAPTSEVSDKSSSPEHTFIFYDSMPQIVDDSEPIRFDNSSKAIRTSPAFSPINLQAGLGGNVQIFRNRIINSRFLTGLGIDFERRRDTWKTVADEDLKFDTSSTVYKKYYSGNTLHTSLVNSSQQRFEYGPEFMLNTSIYLGRFISLDNEIRLFSPLLRMDDPDLIIRNLLSLHLTGNVIIDYDYNYNLTQALEEELKVNEGRHRILLRISFSR